VPHAVVTQKQARHLKKLSFYRSPSPWNCMKRPLPDDVLPPLALVAIVAIVGLVALTVIERTGETRPALMLLAMVIGVLRGPTALQALRSWWR
jgi:hypothetical protein